MTTTEESTTPQVRVSAIAPDGLTVNGTIVNIVGLTFFVLDGEWGESLGGYIVRVTNAQGSAARGVEVLSRYTAKRLRDDLADALS